MKVLQGLRSLARPLLQLEHFGMKPLKEEKGAQVVEGRQQHCPPWPAIFSPSGVKCKN